MASSMKVKSKEPSFGHTLIPIPKFDFLEQYQIASARIEVSTKMSTKKTINIPAPMEGEQIDYCGTGFSLSQLYFLMEMKIKQGALPPIYQGEDFLEWLKGLAKEVDSVNVPEDQKPPEPDDFNRFDIEI